MSKQMMIAALCIAMACIAVAETRIWSGGNGLWHDAASWTPVGAPKVGEMVVISAGTVTLTNATPWLSGVTLATGAKLHFGNGASNVLAAAEVSLAGTVTHAYNTALTTNSLGGWNVDGRVWVVCSNLTVTGTINADYCGYTNRVGDGGGAGYGPAAGKRSTSMQRGGGGGNGGNGGNGTDAAQGDVFGSNTVPDTPGSSGGSGSSPSLSNNYGGKGGGVIRLEVAEALLLDGVLTANGGNGAGGGGGGAGGSIYIKCATIAGSGKIRANGGAAGTTDAGGGGGGRIAVHYNAVAQANLPWQPNISFAANPGRYYKSIKPRPGTLYFSDAHIYPHTGVSGSGRLVNQGVTEYQLTSLAVTNGSLFAFPVGTAVTITDNLTVSGNSAIELDNGALTVGGDARFSSGPLTGYSFESVLNLHTGAILSVGGTLTAGSGVLQVRGEPGDSGLTLSVGNNLQLESGASFYIYCGATNALVTPLTTYLSVRGDMSVASGAWFYPVSDGVSGGSALMQLRNLTLEAGGGINAVGTGFTAETVGIGRGFGGAKRSTDFNRGGGGGHGGKGGRGYTQEATRGATYGIHEAPVWPGSAGATGVSAGNYGGGGGGLVKIEATGTVTINGSILANGGNGNGGGGGGSGGAVHISCKHTAGNGTITANGGACTVSNAGAGGGGIIALTDWTTDAFSGTITALPGTVGDAGDAGFVSRLVSHELVAITVAGDPVPHGAPLPYAYGENGVWSGSVLTNTVISPADEAAGQRFVCLGWSVYDADQKLIATGDTTQAVFTAAAGMIQVWHWTNMWQLAVSSGPNGALTVDPSGWFTNGLSTTAVASPDAGYSFNQWSGDVTPQQATATSVTVLMDRPRRLQANFASHTPEAKVWAGSGAWDEAGRWSPPGMPGPHDTVMVGSGTALLTDSTTFAALAITGTAAVVFSNVTVCCDGNLLLTNSATLTIRSGETNGSDGPFGARLEVGGMMRLSSGTKFRPESHPVNGGSVAVSVGRLEVAVGAVVDADGAGYGNRGGNSVAGYGLGGGGAGGYRGGGGGYGGRGGNGTGSIGGAVYGSESAPDAPGSAGGTHDRGDRPGAGGGLIHVEAIGSITLNGSLKAAGGSGNGGGGGGSGGGIFLRCTKFIGNGTITANGGNAGESDGGGGGGGRVALWSQTRPTLLDSVTVTKGVGGTGAADGTIYWRAYKAGLMVIIR